MKFSAVVALAASASAATLQKKQALEYGIGNFYADCIPHSTFCSYNFTVISDPVLPPSHCGAFLQGPDQLPDVEDGSCPDNVAYTWSATTTTEGGLDFAIWYPFNSRSNITYCHSIPASQIVTENNGAVSTQHYRGPANFTASVLDCNNA
ncbi:hypothetical protein BJ166DRAFT_589515 [Pestalotiopsis sp. NC0098]|nr:hypothetical protein BJ166DRAFT_589515 [Pestalotiopsis sp. NC0098]KAI4600847.1 hypothetical protein KJ359_013010 [Pestalotiopsis sp. 9143b]